MNDKEKRFWFFLGVLAVFFILFVLVVRMGYANYTHYPTLTPTVLPTPSDKECEGGDAQIALLDCLPTASPSATPIPTIVPEPEQSTQTSGSSVSHAGCTDSLPGVIANIYVKTTGNSAELEVQWSIPENASQAHISYGLEKSPQYALLNTPNDGNEVIHNLASGEHYWFSVAGVNGCAVGSQSAWFDPLVP